MSKYYAKVEVEKAAEFKFGPDIYPMTALVRGYCVIVDNYKFDYCPYRAGSRTDACRLHQIFSQLKFSIIHEKNFTAKQILDLFDFISKRKELIKHNAIVLIILSHGHHGIICGTDYRKVNESITGAVFVRQLIEKFSDNKCLALKGKPKMFFFSCCRGDEYDTIEKDVSVFTDDHLSDIFVGYGTRLGKVAFRDQRGSWFGVALAEAIVKHAFDMEFEELFKKIEFFCREKTHKYIDEEFNAKEAEQIPNFEKYKWTKKLYFNPGLTFNSFNSYEITGLNDKHIIKNVIILGQTFHKIGLKTHHLTEFGPPIVYEVKPDSLASKFNIRNGDIIVKLNNEWTFCTEKKFESLFKQKKLKRFEIILIRLKYLKVGNIREIKASICDKLSQHITNGTQTNGEVIQQEIELTQELGKVWELALTQTKDKSEINEWHYLSIDMNVFENSYRINETEPYIAKNYGIQLVSDLDIPSEPPLHIRNHFEKLIDNNVIKPQDISKPWMQRLFRKC